MNKLEKGNIKAGKTCPYTNMCGDSKIFACNGTGCPVSDGKVTNVDFSCAHARGIQMMMNKRLVCLIRNPKVSKGRLKIDDINMKQIYIIEPFFGEYGDQVVDLQGERSIQVFIETEEMRLRGFNFEQS